MATINKIILTLIIASFLFSSSARPAHAEALSWYARLFRNFTFRTQDHINNVRPLFEDGDRREGLENIRPVAVPEFDLITGAATALSSLSAYYFLHKKKNGKAN